MYLFLQDFHSKFMCVYISAAFKKMLIDLMEVLVYKFIDKDFYSYVNRILKKQVCMNKYYFSTCVSKKKDWFIDIMLL